jgi:hypothetical protein
LQIRNAQNEKGMRVRLNRTLALTLAVVCSLLLAACRGRNAQPIASVSPSPTALATAQPTGTTVPSIRAVNFADPSLAGDLIRRAGGGEVQQERVLFADLVGKDGLDEAVVIVDSGGTAGELGAGIYGLRDARPVLLQFFRYNGRIELRGDLVVTLEALPQPGDAQCCPSKLRETTYHWDGATFARLTQQEIANPAR